VEIITGPGPSCSEDERAVSASIDDDTKFTVGYNETSLDAEDEVSTGKTDAEDDDEDVGVGYAGMTSDGNVEVSTGKAEAEEEVLLHPPLQLVTTMMSVSTLVEVLPYAGAEKLP